MVSGRAKSRAGTKIKVSPGGRIFDIANYVFITLFILTIIYPFWNVVLRAFSPVEEVSGLGLHIWIKRWTTGSWVYVFRNSEVGLAYFNTVFRTVVGTLFTLGITMTAGYTLSKRTLPGRNIITLMFLFTMFFSGGLIPSYLLVKSIGLMNTRWALILPIAMNVFYIIIARNFLMTVDQAMEDSAVIDGAGYLTVLVRIMVPLAKPVIATIALWTAVQHWNAWFDAMIYIDDMKKRVLQLLIRDMIKMLRPADLDAFTDELSMPEPLPPQSVQAVTILVTIGPIIAVYPFAQKYFVKGVMLGSLKG